MKIKETMIDKKMVLGAIVLTALVGCTSNDYVGDESLAALNGNLPIGFTFDVPMPTRAGGDEAATALNRQFIVYAEKNEIGGTSPAEGNLVFPNYQVNYISGSSSVSNSKGWEYVGYTHSSEYHANISTSYTDAQTIKFWDYGATNYVFTAVSAKPEDITAGRVKIVKTTSGSTKYDKGYVLTMTKDATNQYPSLKDLYFSDRNVIAKSSESNPSGVNKYGGNATMTFRNTLSQIRVGMYETIPGYSISSISFKMTGDVTAVDGSNNPTFGAACPNVTPDNFEGTITATYYSGTDGGSENLPKLTIVPNTGLSKADLVLGKNINAISKTSPLATTAASPTWDTAEGKFTSVLPQSSSNSSNLKLKVSYTMYNSVTHETIDVKDATAEVPASYIAWKPNYKYTYLFKISEKTNGHTGESTDPSGLYPITFDAVQIVASDGQAEYITTVTEPSITTFGVSGGKYVYGGSEYASSCDIYATIMENNSVVVPEEGDGAGHVNYYSVAYKTGATDSEKNANPITEASVAKSISVGTTTQVIVCTKDNDLGAPVTTVPGEDGIAITQNAVKFESMQAGIYAIEYTPTSGDKVYKVITVQ